MALKRKSNEDVINSRNNMLMASHHGIFNEADDTLAASKEYKFLPLDTIYNNPINEPYMIGITEEDVKALSENIAADGLMHNLVVIRDDQGRYRLISGEKRWRALCLLSEEVKKEKFPKGVMAKVIDESMIKSKLDEKILLLVCNVFTFSGDMINKKQLADLILCYQEKGAERKEILSFLKNKLNMSDSKLKRLYSEATSIPELYDLCYKEGIITPTALSILAMAKPEKQQQYVDYIHEKYDNPKASEEEVGKNPVIDQAVASEIKKKVSKGAAPKVEGSPEAVKFLKCNMNIKKDIERMKKVNFSKSNEIEIAHAKSELEKTLQSLTELLRQIN